MKVLVTGAAGFIGSHLCDCLLAKGHVVYGVDNLITGKIDNLKEAANNGAFTFKKMDICKELPREKFDWLFNAASIASPRHYYAHPIETLLVGSQGLFNCLQKAVSEKSRILHFSTSEVYGDPTVHPQVETYWGNVNPIGQRSCYDESKRFGEALCKAFEKTHGVDVRIVRIFNTYGPRMSINDGRLIPELTIQALKGENLTIFGNGLQTRSFCYADDLILGLYAFMEKPGLKGEVINLGNPTEFTLLQFTELLLQLTGSGSQVRFKPPMQDDPVRRCPDIAKAKKLLGWAPTTSLKTGLLETIHYFKKLI